MVSSRISTRRSSLVQKAINEGMADDDINGRDYFKFNRSSATQLAPDVEVEEAVDVDVEGWLSDEDTSSIVNESGIEESLIEMSIDDSSQNRSTGTQSRKSKKRKHSHGCRCGSDTGICRNCYCVKEAENCTDSCRCGSKCISRNRVYIEGKIVLMVVQAYCLVISQKMKSDKQR